LVVELKRFFNEEAAQADTKMDCEFPAVGHRYLVDFRAFRVELFFHSETSLTWTGIKPDGNPGDSETELISVKPLREGLFLVTWQESDKTTVVHIEDYVNNRIITNITSPPDTTVSPPVPMQFAQFHGTMTQIS
jgi:hypothetical protein